MRYGTRPFRLPEMFQTLGRALPAELILASYRGPLRGLPILYSRLRLSYGGG